MALVWLALVLGLAAVTVSVVFATRRAIRLYRDVKHLTGSAGSALDDVNASTHEIERHLTLAAESGTTLGASLARLRVSRARLNVQRAALADVRDSLTRVTALRPRK